MYILIFHVFIYKPHSRHTVHDIDIASRSSVNVLVVTLITVTISHSHLKNQNEYCFQTKKVPMSINGLNKTKNNFTHYII